MLERGARFAALLLTTAVTAAACAGGAGFRPASPVSVTARPASVTLEAVDVAGLTVVLPHGEARASGLTPRLRWHALEPGTGLARAFLAPPEAAPCTAGVEAELVEIDGQIRWDRAAGLDVDHAVVLGFPRDSRLEEAPLVLDLDVTDAAGRACVRVPLTGEGRRYTPPDPGVTLGAAIALTAPARSGSGVAFGIDILPARWVGPLLLSLRLGFSFDANHLSAGGGDVDSSAASSSPFPRYGEAHVVPQLAFLPWAGRQHALGIEAGYVFGAGSATAIKDSAGNVTTPGGDSTFSGPRLGLVLASIERPLLGAPLTPGTALTGVELSATRASVWSGEPARGAAYVLGLGLVGWW
jgi:hypothetical protein